MGSPCVAMTQSTLMRPIGALLLTTLGIAFLPAAQAPADEPVAVQTEHPRLLLRPQRLRLLKRERERTSMRWQQFEALVAGGAPMPEQGFATALYYQVSGDAAYGRQAVAWALGPGTDLRQMALVFDWCQDLLTDSAAAGPDRRACNRELPPPKAPRQWRSGVRSRAMAAIALYDHVPQIPAARVGADRARLVGAARWHPGSEGRAERHHPGRRLSVVRAAPRDPRQYQPRSCGNPAGRFFKDYPIEHLISYYPAVYRGTRYRVLHRRRVQRPAIPTCRLATLSRAGGTGYGGVRRQCRRNQVLQGWLMHDRFMLKSTFGDAVRIPVG